MPHPSWNERYASGELPWDTGEPEPLLVEFVTSGGIKPTRRSMLARVLLRHIMRRHLPSASIVIQLDLATAWSACSTPSLVAEVSCRRTSTM